MTKVTMPDPMVEVDKHIVSSELQYTYLAPCGGLEHGTELITTAQAEAYKDACVRELQAAAKDLADWAEHDVGAWPELTPGLKEIRALIPKDEP